LTGENTRLYNCRGDVMRVHIGKIKGKRGAYEDFSFHEALPAPWEGVEASRDVPVEFVGRVTNTGKGYHVEGVLRAVATVPCDRCLEPFRLEMASQVAEEFRSAPYGTRDSTPDQESPGEDQDALDDWNVFQGDTISLDDVVREHLVLALPPKLLCHAACKGICPKCGQNRNQVACDCMVDDVDPRLSALMDLLKKDQ